MGCDIHMLIERQDKTGVWRLYRTMRGFVQSHGDRDWAFPAAGVRNYRRFAALAGVRGDGPPPKGLPADVSPDSQALIDDCELGDHSFSWDTLADATRIFAATEYWDEKEDGGFKKYPASYYWNVDDDDISRYRLLYGFDS